MSKTTTLKNLVKLSSQTNTQLTLNKDHDYEPSRLVVANILNYSKALSIRNTNLVGAIEMILN